MSGECAVRIHYSYRRGALAVESAIVQATMIVLLLALVAGGMGVFRYQQVVMLSREAARAVSVKGSVYQRETGKASPTQQEILQNVVQPLATSMDLTQLTLTIEWIDGATGAVVPWDSSTKAPQGTTATGARVNNRIRVTITYQWSPQLFGVGPCCLKSVAEQPMSS
jgi:Flp pilus assembly protein TadG